MRPINKKHKIIWSLSILFVGVFSVIGIWSNIKAISIVASFLWMVILVAYIVYSVKNGRIKRI